MKATVFTPALLMFSAIAVAIITSDCGVLNIQARFASIGSTMRDDDASVMAGVLPSPSTGSIASEFGVVVEPMIASTRSSLISLRVFVTVAVVSDASSSTMYCNDLPAISFGNSSTVFFSGMPSAAAGPVDETVTPILICAWTGDATRATSAAMTHAPARGTACKRTDMVSPSRGRPANAGRDEAAILPHAALRRR